MWIATARELIANGRIELIGSGYSQMIGPLVPARVTAENLRLGVVLYQRLLGTQPRLALVNEQAYAGGLVALYREAGFEALLMDWDNPAAHHPEWDSETQYLPQIAVGPAGEEIALIWSNTTLFQQLQRFAHGDTELAAYRSFVRGKRGADLRSLCLYASDAEIFDFRPGRFKTEERLGETSEWARIETALAAAVADGAHLVAPSAVLELMEAPGAGNRLTLESAVCPVPVKKQRKYNLARWAVTGRDNTAVNAACERIYQGMLTRPDADWKELCYLWASDFRTHLTENRWTAFCARLKAAEAKWSAPRRRQPAPPTPALTGRFLDIITPQLKARLDRRRGLALQSLQFAPHARATIGGLPHGTFDDIALAADWYTGDCVFEVPGEHKLTDLEWCEARIETQANGDVVAHARIDTPRGVIEKQMRFAASRAAGGFRPHLPLGGLGQGGAAAGPFHLAARGLRHRRTGLRHQQWRRARDLRAVRAMHRSRCAGIVPGVVQPGHRHDRRLDGDRRRPHQAAHRSGSRHSAAAGPTQPPSGEHASRQPKPVLPVAAFGTGAGRHPQARMLSDRTQALPLLDQRCLNTP